MIGAVLAAGAAHGRGAEVGALGTLAIVAGVRLRRFGAAVATLRVGRALLGALGHALVAQADLGGGACVGEIGLSEVIAKFGGRLAK